MSKQSHHKQTGLFGDKRMQMTESIEMTIGSLHAYADRDHVAVAWSGGKDSSTLVTLYIHLILAGKVRAPKTLTILYADTRLELLPLWASAESIREEMLDHADALLAMGTKLDVRIVMAPMDKRFMVYILGRGVPPPNNRTLRWCTVAIKIDPMAEELRKVACDLGLGAMVEGPRGLVYQGFGKDKLLVLTGVRVGESAVRDARITLSCSGNNAECGQGWYQQELPEALCDTLAPILHWRVCHVWSWLKHHAPTPEFGDWTTEPLADAYGGDEAEEANARTGCVGCPLVEHDSALDAIIRQIKWAYLAPLKKLRPIWRWLRTSPVRLRKKGGETRKDGSLVANQQRMGPITRDARLEALAQILAIQAEVNVAADALGRPRLDILNAEEEARIRELVAANTWPDKWTGDEPLGNEEFEPQFADGTSQPLLIRAMGWEKKA